MSEMSLSALGREHDLDQIIGELLALEGEGPLDARALDGILRRHPKDGCGFFSKREILRAFRGAPGRWPVSEAAFAERMRTCPTRSLSGILPVTVLTKPHPCPGRCIFCPDDVRMPKSYLADEPGCQRALQNGFDPFRQAWNRLRAYHDMGHRTDKVELIVLGGTWSAYPERYQRWFIARLFEALNRFDPSQAPPVDDELQEADWARVERAHRANETAGSRCVGLSLETRPDHVTEAEVLRLRRLGATKVQLGLQSLDDSVLAANRRGHDVEASRRAMTRLRGAGFKLHAHWMANLHGSTPERDVEDFARLFEDPALCPDELKVYPCSLLETAELMDVYARGDWRPYSHDELVELLARCLPAVPAWCRVSRVIRDIPSPDIVVGNRKTNLREVVEARVKEQGGRLTEIRSREVRGETIDPGRLEFVIRSYPSELGKEHFLELATPAGRIAGFARLTLPRGEAPQPELRDRALLREVHIYGNARALGERSEGVAQHTGLGRKLVEQAAQLAADSGYATLAVISAVGTRAWYRRLGFTDGTLYQHLPTQ
ncbi:MAG: tRNA uridine(34) 5-carboxymethylaminomethyl modification radical SAM/GNAT enzyme Elp3 [Deltaproteobacteria bacterium]|nr:tRNA uridine(34) 5-carboxymethylaminomethyl modification radical SAM/GNAT enzyme Elp3 [Deltaproteobacteria bacterium]MBW2394748.1 tRNA uridine(34) 5-carboxymethylaminomethyl modification radical SAM/GNAT enzyme Elp3 [Deltaproteobacteria bacterium]